MDNDLISAAEFGPDQGSAKVPVGGPPATATRPVWVFTSQETRNTALMLSCPLFPFLDGKLLRTSAERGDGDVHMSAHRQPFSMGLQKSAFRWKSRESVQNPASHRKMREAQCSPRLAFPSGLGSAAANAK